VLADEPGGSGYERPHGAAAGVVLRPRAALRAIRQPKRA
jgi:hypothetical protein